MKHYYRRLGQALIAVSTVYFTWFLIDNAESLHVLNWDLRKFISVTCATAIYSIALLLGACTWSIFLYGLGESFRLRDTFKVFFVSQFAKYVPGNFAHHLGRISMARKYELRTPQVVLTIVLESGWVILVGTFLVLVFFVSHGFIFSQDAAQLPHFRKLVLLFGGGLILPVLGVWIINHWGPPLLRKATGYEEFVVPSLVVFGVCFLLYLLIFLLLGLALYVLLAGAFQLSNASYWTTTGIFCLAWMAGFITPGAPAGLGIREALLISFLTPIHGAGIALGVTILLRVVTTLGDGMAFVAALFVKRKGHRELSV
jgi:hypothetical protein